MSGEVHSCSNFCCENAALQPASLIIFVPIHTKVNRVALHCLVLPLNLAIYLQGIASSWLGAQNAGRKKRQTRESDHSEVSRPIWSSRQALFTREACVCTFGPSSAPCGAICLLFQSTALGAAYHELATILDWPRLLVVFEL